MKRADGWLSRRPLGAASTFVPFGGAALLLAFVTGPAHRAFIEAAGVEPVVAWFILGGLGLFLPLLFLAFLLLRAEGIEPARMRERLRFRPMNEADWAWTGAGLAAIAGATGLIVLGSRWMGVELDLHPPFMRLAPLDAGRYWLLALWVPFWLLNILGEEILWRGVILPRQEEMFGAAAWLANAVGWLFFHLAFGWTLMLILVPTIVVLPYVVQRRRNSWIGVLLHAALNGPGFLAVAFGIA